MTKTVLIVEDDELNLRLFDDVLTLEGYRTRVARCGDGALASARRERPDLILMDIELPGGSGLDVAAEIRRSPELADVPVLAVTAHARQGDAERMRAGGCAGYISKPISVRGFVETVRRFA